MNNGETKHMNTTPQLVFGLEKILDYLVENNGYSAQIGNTTIYYRGIKEDTANRKRQVFEIERKVETEDK